eukprot:CAMPEP_0206586516 /NCGR_PEP_ID=MMETSP0325_2-20121206/37070_1 /ASSEMBLY_ACC=CAM_ASM_000347 /TAXON_ID=2866 /ORGANISM="Crypthecodinium cohnii, Strain Seligo" /LENGTH=880 /DNA_ID=CAMNT_0054094291 /DNA_START=9 /DNA_END=2652 /DNA_ORIENTATION=+
MAGSEELLAEGSFTEHLIRPVAEFLASQPVVRQTLHRFTLAQRGTSARNEPIVLDAVRLLDAVPEVHPLLGRWPVLISLLEAALQAAWALISSRSDPGLSSDGAEAPRADAILPRLRLMHIPGCEFARFSVAELRVADRGCFVKFVGTVTRAGSVKVVQEWREFRCESCGHRFRLRASPENGYDFELPTQCRSGEKKTTWDPKVKRPKTMRCHSKAFQLLPPGEDCMADFQEVRVQDQMQALDAGVVPQSIAVPLFGDLVASVQPGDTVLVEGVVYQRWRAPFVGKRLELELFIEASHAERLSTSSASRKPGSGIPSALPAASQEQASNHFENFWAQTRSCGDEWKARSELIRGVAPWLSGLPVPKLALLLTLIGGAPIVEATTAATETEGEGQSRWARFQQGAAGGAAGGPSSSTQQPEQQPSAKGDPPREAVRTTPHLLLLGDPGTGKSQLLQAAQELSSRSVRTSGLGCTNAGLTCAAVRDGPDFVLEAGALVLADGGVCCIDEFSTIRSHDRAAVHEAMEQQTVSVAKAGLVCRLRSQCSVVAAQNCKGGSAHGRGASYDCSSSLVVNSGLPPPLLSRFDLVVVFAGGGKGASSEQDKADFIVGFNENPRSASRDNKTGGMDPPTESYWTHELLKEYITWARTNPLNQPPEPKAQEVIERYFTKLRAEASDAGGGGSGITVRTFQSIWRLAQAHARLMHHDCVRLEDAVAVLVLHKAALQSHAVGTDSTGDGDDFAPTLPDVEGEIAPCTLRSSPLDVELHHGSDIPDVESYRSWEAWVLRYVQPRRARPVPLADVPTPQQGLPPSQRREEPAGSQQQQPSCWSQSPVDRGSDASQSREATPASTSSPLNQAPGWEALHGQKVYNAAEIWAADYAE